MRVENADDFCVKRTAETEFKVDWPCSVGWNEVSNKALLSEAPKEPVSIRATLELTDFYGGPFTTNKDTHYAFTAGAPGETLLLYAPRKSPRGQKLFSATSDGKAHK